MWWCCWCDGDISWPYLMYDKTQIHWCPPTMILWCQNGCQGVPFIVSWGSPQVDTSSDDSCLSKVSKLLVVKLSCMSITWGSSKGRYFQVDNYEHYLGFKYRKIF
jgi:hypothetical protein